MSTQPASAPTPHDRFRRYLAEALANLDQAVAQLAAQDLAALRASLKRSIDLIAGASDAAGKLDDATAEHLFLATRAVNAMIIDSRNLADGAPLLTAAREQLTAVLGPEALA
jgi:hypothetical protein